MIHVPKKLKLSLILLAGLVLLLLWMQGAFRSRVRPGVHPVAASPPTGRLHPVAVQEVLDWQEAPGLVVSRDQPQVAAQIMARVQEIKVVPGAAVQAGQILAVLDEAEVRARVGQAQGALDAAQAHLVRAEADYRRSTALLPRKVIPQKDFDAAAALYHSARGQVRQAAQALREAQAQLAYTTVRAPFAGLVAEKMVDPGDLAAPGRALFTLYDPARLRLEAQVGEQYGPELQVGAPTRVLIPSLNLEIPAALEEIDEPVASASRTFLIKARLPQHPGLRPGMFGRLAFAGKTRAALLAPAAAVRLLGQLETVRVAEGDQTSLRQVKTGKRYGDNLEILSGLRPGEQVVLE